MASYSIDRTPSVLAVCFGGIGVQVTALSLRFWSRIVSRTPLWWDDWTALGAAPFSIAVCIQCLYYAFYKGYGKPAIMPDRPPSWPVFSYHDYIIGTFVSGKLYNMSISLVKLSALLFYGRIFGCIRWFRIALWITAVLCVVWNIAFSVKGFAMQEWQDDRVTYESKKVTFIASSLSNLVIDLIILLLPHPVLWKTQMGGRRKLGLTFVFLVGYSVVGISIYRVISMAMWPGTIDLGYSTVYATNALVIEVPVAIAGVSLPTIFSLVRRARMHGVSALLSTRQYPSASAQPAVQACRGTERENGCPAATNNAEKREVEYDTIHRRETDSSDQWQTFLLDAEDQVGCPASIHAMMSSHESIAEKGESWGSTPDSE